jgi:endonuclease YncB( thermonuclease family)
MAICSNLATTMVPHRTQFLLLAALLIPTTVFAADFTGLVVSVLDADTLEVLHNHRPERICLSGIECPEKVQAYGQRAKQTVLPAFRTVCLWRGGGALVEGGRSPR